MDYPTNEELYGHIPPISKSLQQQRMRFAGYCWRSKGAGDVLLWRPTHGHQPRGRPKKTYTDQWMDDRGSRLEELPIAMKDRDRWREGHSWDTEQARPDDDDDDETPATFFCRKRKVLMKCFVTEFGRC